MSDPQIIVTRQETEIRLQPGDFDDFAFVHGDRLQVSGLESVEHKFTPDQCVSFRAPTGDALRVPPVVEFSRFRDFDLQEHLVLLTGAGTYTLEGIGAAHVELYKKHMGIFPDMTFLEIGSGIGRDAFQLMGLLSPKGRYIGIDVTRESVAWCQKNITARHTNFIFHHYDAVHELYNPLGTKTSMDFLLPIDSNQVDRVSLGSVFTHLFEEEILHYLREIRRVLRPNGRAYATFFLHSPETIEAVNRTNASGLRFSHPYATGCFVHDKDWPTGAVAYTDEAIRRMVAEADLELTKPYLVGAWSGRSKTPDEGQEALVLKPARKAFFSRIFSREKR